MIITTLHRLIRYSFHRHGFQSCYLQLDSSRLHYLQRQCPQASKRLVLIHGLGTSSSSWIKILPSLSKSYTISCLDLPGYGFSKITSGDPFFSLTQLDCAVEQFIQRTQRLPIILIGHSLGGWLAARAALNHPESVEHLILINNAGIQYPGVGQQADLFDLLTLDDARQLLHHIWSHYPWYFNPFTSSIFQSLKKKHVSDFVRSIREEDFLNQKISALPMPVDVIWGNEDRLISKESVNIMKKLLPDLSAHSIPQCGHVPQLEKPHQVSLLLNQILASSQK
jgi:pimeloyl-ACP methyl ester carboxylesterase